MDEKGVVQRPGLPEFIAFKQHSIQFKSSPRPARDDKEPHPIRIEDGRERLVAASPVMTKSWDPSSGKQLPGKLPRKIAET